jgi:hypothetical protein
MAWLFGIVLVVLFVILMIKYPGFRIGTLIVALLIGAGTWMAIENEDRKDKRAASLIKKTEIEFRDLRLSLSTYGSHDLKGSLKNLSQEHTLKSLTMLVKAFDCPEKKLTPRCEVICESREHIYIRVPPGQVRQINEYVTFSHMPKARNFLWSYSVEKVTAALK